MANPNESSAGRQDAGTNRPGQDNGQRDADQRKPAAGSDDAGGQDYRGDGPGKIGLTSDHQPDLVAPSGVNERDHGAADDQPAGGGTVNFDDDDMEHPRGDVSRTGGTRNAKGGDSAPLGAPGAGLSDRNGPSDPDTRKQ